MGFSSNPHILEYHWLPVFYLIITRQSFLWETRKRKKEYEYRIWYQIWCFSHLSLSEILSVIIQALSLNTEAWKEPCKRIIKKALIYELQYLPFNQKDEGDERNNAWFATSYTHSLYLWEVGKNIFIHASPVEQQATPRFG